MARTVLPIVGAAVGTFFGAPQIGFAIGSIIGNAVDPQRIKGPRIGDVNLQTSQEGAPRPIVYGTAAVMGNLIDRGPLEKVITEERQGKGGGPVVENESLYMTFAIRICEGPIDGISRIWEDEKLVYDIRPESQIVGDSMRYAEGFNLYLGDEDQLPDPELEVIHGVGNTPAHRGSAYIVFVRKNLTDRRGSIPQFRFEVNGCTSIPFTESGDWVAFGPSYAIVTDDPENWSGEKRFINTGWEGGGAGFASGVLIAAANNLGESAHRSIDRANSFLPISFPSSPNPDNNRRVDKFGSRWFLGTPSTGTLYSDDNGITWTLSNIPDGTTATTHSRWQSGSAIYGIAQGQQLVRKSTDNGNTWEYVKVGGVNVLIGRISTTIVRSGSACIAFSDVGGEYNRVRRSVDDCLTWSSDITVPSSASSRFNPRCVEVGDGFIVAVNDIGQIVYSGNNGITWALAGYTFPGVPRFLLFALGRWTIVGEPGAIAVSNGGPDSWAAVPSGSFGSDNITSIAFMNRRVYG